MHAATLGEPPMSQTTRSAIVALAGIAAALFVAVAAHELDYASSHPYAYGPAKVIAVACGAGALLSIAVIVLALAVARSPEQD